MRFDLVDAVLERGGERIVTVKNVTAAEEYLGDHFPGFPILPGVMMLEAMVQAARRFLEEERVSGTFSAAEKVPDTLSPCCLPSNGHGKCC